MTKNIATTYVNLIPVIKKIEGNVAKVEITTKNGVKLGEGLFELREAPEEVTEAHNEIEEALPKDVFLAAGRWFTDLAGNEHRINDGNKAVVYNNNTNTFTIYGLEGAIKSFKTDPETGEHTYTDH